MKVRSPYILRDLGHKNIVRVVVQSLRVLATLGEIMLTCSDTIPVLVYLWWTNTIEPSPTRRMLVISENVHLFSLDAAFREKELDHRLDEQTVGPTSEWASGMPTSAETRRTTKTRCDVKTPME